MNKGHILPPNLSCAFIFVCLFVEALFSQILKDDLTAFNILIAWFDSTVFACSKAIILQIFFLTESTFPEYVSWCHENFISEFAIVFFEV